MKTKIEVRDVKALLSHIEDSNTPESYVSIVDWINGSGFDVEICENGVQKISISYEAWRVMKKLVKKLYKNDFDKEEKK